jgi:hypothetical protein
LHLQLLPACHAPAVRPIRSPVHQTKRWCCLSLCIAPPDPLCHPPCTLSRPLCATVHAVMGCCVNWDCTGICTPLSQALGGGACPWWSTGLVPFVSPAWLLPSVAVCLHPHMGLPYVDLCLCEATLSVFCWFKPLPSLPNIQHKLFTSVR